jgi:hypothetical protein
MSATRRDQFIKRLSSVGMGTRESVHVLLGSIVYDVREHVVRKQFKDEEMDAVVTFHDQAEALWRDTLSTDPPLDAEQMVARLAKLRDACTGPLGLYQGKLERGVRSAEEFQKEHSQD